MNSEQTITNSFSLDPQSNKDRESQRSAASPVVLYLFAGEQRKSDVASFLKGHGWKVIEYDILRNKNHDLTKASLRARLLGQIQKGMYNAVIASPPCSTFSRVTYANSNGPKPARSLQYPRGFPWIRGERRRIIEIGNQLADFAFEALLEQSRQGGIGVMEFPEDLGSIKSGQWKGC